MSDDLIGVTVIKATTRVVLPRAFTVANVDPFGMEVTLSNGNGVRVVMPLSSTAEVMQWELGTLVELHVPELIEKKCPECLRLLAKGGHGPHCSKRGTP
jgi:hypothetical protein